MKLTGRVLILISLSLACQMPTLAAQQERNSAAESAAQSLFAFLLSRDGKIGTDAAAQDRWLSPSLKALMRNASATIAAARASGKEEMGPDPHEPSNDTFFFAWDSPTACTATSSKPYGSGMLVFVTCGWGPRTNYPGMTADYALVMPKYEDRWLVDDIWFTNREEKYSSTLRRNITKSIADADRFRKRGRW